MTGLVILIVLVFYLDRVRISKIIIKSFLILIFEQKRYYPEYQKDKLMYNIIKSFIDFIQ